MFHKVKEEIIDKKRQQDIDAILVLSKVLEVNNVATTDTQKLADSKIKELIQKL